MWKKHIIAVVRTSHMWRTLFLFISDRTCSLDKETEDEREKERESRCTNHCARGTFSLFTGGGFSILSRLCFVISNAGSNILISHTGAWEGRECEGERKSLKKESACAVFPHAFFLLYRHITSSSHTYGPTPMMMIIIVMMDSVSHLVWVAHLVKEKHKSLPSIFSGRYF